MEAIERFLDFEITIGQALLVVLAIFVFVFCASFIDAIVYERRRKKRANLWRQSHPDHW